MLPQPVQGIVGDSITLECEPPRGHPEPQIRWKKNGQALELDLDLGVDSDRSAFFLFLLKFRFDKCIFKQITYIFGTGFEWRRTVIW